MTRFNFANLVGGRSKPKASEESEREEEALDEEDPEAADEGGEADAANGGEDDEAAGGDEEQEASSAEKAAFRRGLASGRKAERERCGAIFAAAEPHTAAMAAHLAFNTSVSPGEAKSTLAAAPKAEGGLASRMKGRDPAPAAQSDAADGDEDKAAARILATRPRRRQAG